MFAVISAVVRLDRLAGRVEWFVAGLCLASIVVCTALGVFFRYVLNDPLVWSNDLGILSLTWLTFTGGSALYKERGHISIEMAEFILSKRLGIAVAVVLTAAMGVGIAIIGWQMLTLIPLQFTKEIEALHIPRAFYGIPLAWACASIAFSSARQLVDGSLSRAITAKKEA